MNTAVLLIAGLAVVIVTALLAWIFARPARPKALPESRLKMITQAPKPKKPAVAAGAPLPAMVETRAVLDGVASGAGPSVEVPKDKSSSRWVGKMIDERPDEAAAVLRRWIHEK